MRLTKEDKKYLCIYLWHHKHSIHIIGYLGSTTIVAPITTKCLLIFTSIEESIQPKDKLENGEVVY